jgi:hypothetical protein
MESKQIKEESRHALIRYRQDRIGQDFDDPYHSMPEWVEIRKILQAIMEYDHDPGTCQHDFDSAILNGKKVVIVCRKCGTPKPEQENEEDSDVKESA